MLQNDFSKIRFDIILSEPCNVVYHTLINKETCIPVVYTEEQLIQYASYIKHILEYANQERIKCLHIDGEKILDSLPQLLPLVEELKEVIDIFNIKLRERLTQSKVENIYTLWRILEDKLNVNVYYRFSLEGEEDTQAYDSFYYNIRWLFSKGLAKNCMVGINPSNAHKIPELFDDFLKLHKEFPDADCLLFLNPSVLNEDSFDKETIENGLKLINSYLEEHQELKSHFSYSPDLAFRERIEDSLMGNVQSVLTKDGQLYPGYNVVEMTNEAKDKFIFGTVEDSHEELDYRKTILLEEVNNISLTDNEKIFRAVPFEDKNNVYNIVPTEQVIILHELLSTYFL